ncbi:MAG: PD40 domain-containing protein [Anaerolineae bacterium]|nr:PD40 domain-containing protein [Anaerolineae bacterium]
MRRFMWIFSLMVFALIAGLLGITSAEAQGTPILSLMLHASGDVWAWDGDRWQNLTQVGSIYEAVVSPDGTRLAYTDFAPVTKEALQREGGIGGGALPTDVHLLDLNTLQSEPIATQPADASFFQPGVPDRIVMRGGLAWSPDGTQLAWSEYNQPDQSDQRVVIYDFTTSESRIAVTSLPQPMGVPSPLPLIWTPYGLTVQGQFVEDDGSFSSQLLTYNPSTGERIQQTRLDTSTSDRFTLDWRPATFEGHEYWAVLYNTAQVEMIDPASGALLPATTTLLETYNPLAGASAGVQIIPNTLNGIGGQWIIYSAAGVPVLDKLFVPYSGMLDYMAVSPDGGQVAYIPADNAGGAFFTDQLVIFVLDDFQVVTLDLPPELNSIQEVWWGPKAWRLQSSGFVEVFDDPAGDCAAALPSDLAINGLARVIPGSGPNRLRNAASSSGTVIGQVPEGGLVLITGDSICEGNIRWWPVEYNGQAGYTAGSVGGNRYLEAVG